MIYEKVVEYCKKEGIKLSEFEKRCEIGNGTIGKWKRDKRCPSLKTLSKIEKATGVPIMYWVGGLS